MIYILYTLFFVSCIMLIASVLLQPGKTDAGALFTSNVSSAAFGPRGTQTILSKITIVAATVFMLTALFIAMPVFQGGVSVLNSNPDTTEAPATTQPPISDVTNSANANVSTASPANTALEAAPANAAPANTAPANANK